MSDFSFDMKNVPFGWSLHDVVACVILNDVMDRGLENGSRVRVVRAVTRAWYEDEHHGFNAEHIEIGGEG